MEDTTWWIGAKEDIEKDDELTWRYTFYSLSENHE